VPAHEHHPRALTNAQIQQFIGDGYVRIDRAFSRDVAEAARAILWRDLRCDPQDPKTWTQPVIRLGGYGGEPFMTAQHSPVLHDAFDQLVGKGRWRRRSDLGAFVVRFPSSQDPGDDGWHIDVSFPGETGDPNARNDFFSWRANVTSKDRALLMLFLFSDVGPLDAPTRILVGSHHDVARRLEPEGEAGLSLREVSPLVARMAAEDRLQVLATGDAGTVYLCHPFLVHAGQQHHGSTVRFLAQPPLHPAEPLCLDRADGDYSPVEIAIRLALQRGGP
jgi:hypothetical protein